MFIWTCWAQKLDRSHCKVNFRFLMFVQGFMGMNGFGKSKSGFLDTKLFFVKNELIKTVHDSTNKNIIHLFAEHYWKLQWKCPKGCCPENGWATPFLGFQHYASQGRRIRRGPWKERGTSWMVWVRPMPPHANSQGECVLQFTAVHYNRSCKSEFYLFLHLFCR